MHSSDKVPSTTRLYGVLADAKEFDLVWQEVVPLLEKTLEYADGKYWVEDVYNLIKNRDMQLWVTYDNGKLLAFCITQIHFYPRKKILGIPFVGGVELHKWLHLINPLREFARENKCEVDEGYVRDGWFKFLKPYGFRKVYTVVQGVL